MLVITSHAIHFSFLLSPTLPALFSRRYCTSAQLKIESTISIRVEHSTRERNEKKDVSSAIE